MRRVLLPLILLAVALPLAAQLPPGVTRIPYPVASGDSFFVAATAEDVLLVAPMVGRAAFRVNPNGTTQVFDIAPGWNFTYDAATGPDGAVWFGGFTGVSRVAVDTIAPQAWLPTAATIVVPGPDGYMWLLANNSVVRMRSDGLIVSSFPGVTTSPSGAAFGSDGALYVATANALVRITASGERTSVPAATRGRLFPGNGFFWSGSRSLQSPHQPPTPGEITKLDYAGRTLATFNLDMTPFVSDAMGNLWLRSTSPAGDILAQLSPSGILTKFGPVPAANESQCFQRYFGGLAILSDGRVAMADYFPDYPRSGIDPCFHVPRPAGQENAITIVDPRIAPVLSVEPLLPTPRRRTSRH